MTDDLLADSLNLADAVNAVRRGEIIAYPTEAVFGLGCDPLNADAIRQVIEIKGRDANKGLIVIAASQMQLSPYIGSIEPQWQLQFDQNWPGPVTFIVPVSTRLPADVARLLTGGRDTIAVRVSAHPVVQALCLLCEHPLVSTSANLSGHAAMRTAQEIRSVFAERLPVVVDQAVGDRLEPSRIIDVVSGRILR